MSSDSIVCKPILLVLILGPLVTEHYSVIKSDRYSLHRHELAEAVERIFLALLNALCVGHQLLRIFEFIWEVRPRCVDQGVVIDSTKRNRGLRGC